MASALIDASALVAAFVSSEPKNQHYLGPFQLVCLEHWSLSTTWPCAAKTSYLAEPAERFEPLKWIGRGAVSVFAFGQEALMELVSVMQRYTECPRTEMDLTDASPYALATDTGVTPIMTLDKRDFSRYKLPDGRRFEIL